MNQLDVLFSRSTDLQDYAVGYSGHLQSLLQKLDVKAVKQFVDALLEADRRFLKVVPERRSVFVIITTDA